MLPPVFRVARVRRVHSLATLATLSLSSSLLVACGGTPTPSAAPSPHAADGGALSGAEIDSGSDPSAPPHEGKIDVIVTVDWEGREVTEANIAAMEALRAKYPNIRIVHFLNAAYFTKSGAKSDAIAATIRRVLRPNDELGLHIHGWKRLFEASGVTFRSGPTFWGTTLTATDCADDCGHEVPIALYTTGEIQKVIAFSVKTLEANGFGHATSFRAGGWLSSESPRGAGA